MKRILSPGDQKAGYEAAKRRERDEAAARGWKPGDSPFVSQALAMDERQKAAREAIDRKARAVSLTGKGE